MRPGRVEAGHLAVRHVRKPRERMPVARVSGGECPFDTGPRQAGLHHRIFRDVIAVVIKREAVVRRRQINRQRSQHKQQRNETGSRHPLFVLDSGAKTKRDFRKKVSSFFLLTAACLSSKLFFATHANIRNTMRLPLVSGQPRNATAQCNRAMQPRNIAQGILPPLHCQFLAYRFSLSTHNDQLLIRNWLRWVSTRGEKDTWSETTSVTIPG